MASSSAFDCCISKIMAQRLCLLVLCSSAHYLVIQASAAARSWAFFGPLKTGNVIHCFVTRHDLQFTLQLQVQLTTFPLPINCWLRSSSSSGLLSHVVFLALDNNWIKFHQTNQHPQLQLAQCAKAHCNPNTILHPSTSASQDHSESWSRHH